MYFVFDYICDIVKIRSCGSQYTDGWHVIATSLGLFVWRQYIIEEGFNCVHIDLSRFRRWYYLYIHKNYDSLR